MSYACGILFDAHAEERAMTEPYEGEELHMCLAKQFDWSRVYVVVVSGVKINPCGHAIINAGGIGGHYFHVTGFHAYPRYMNDAGYRRYLREESKQEIRRHIVIIRDPDGAQRKLDELLAKKWSWFVLPHNCAAFVEDIIQAGGSKAGLWSNCPRAEAFD
jgi:hypothetical protein